MDDFQLIATATQYAYEKHAGQVRKFTAEDYIWHPCRVAGMVVIHGGTPAMVAAAWVHDVAEDCGPRNEVQKRLDEILHVFGLPVADLVHMLTAVTAEGTYDHLSRAERKEIDREHLSQVRPEAKTIKIADRLDNLRDIHLSDRGFRRTYIEESALLLPCLVGGNADLYSMLDDRVYAAKEELEREMI